MKPEILTVKNFGPFRGAHTVDFTALGDIFLVYGKTGAGKTTLFDAISYAFYGKVPGSRNGIEKLMKSQFAGDDEVASVELAFTTGGRRFRISRTLAYEKIGVRSGKAVAVQEESTLDEWSAAGTRWKSLTSTNKSETDRKILDIIKLSAEEFSRIVLLPQGEFARFLKLNSNERKDVLSKLFPVSRYTQVIELARVRAKEATLRVTETEKAIELLRADFNALSWETDRAAIEAELAALRETQAALRAELSLKSALLERSRAMRDKIRQERELSKRLEALEERGAVQETLKKELSGARKAEPLIARLAALESAQDRSKKARAEKEKTAKELEAVTALLADLDLKADGMKDALLEREAILVRKERLTQAVKMAETLERLEEESGAAKKELSGARKNLDAIEAENAKHARRIAELEPLVNAIDERSRMTEKCRDELEKRKRQKETALEYEREKNACAAHRAAVAASDELIRQNRADLSIAQAECADLEAEEKRKRDGELASDLALTLEDGRPCPVCGSLTHPSPASRGMSRDIPVTERLGAAKRRIESLEKEYARLSQERAARNAHLENAGERVSLISAKAPDGESIPSPAEAARNLQEAVDAAQKASDELALARSALRETGELRARLAQAEAGKEGLKKAISDLEAESAKRKADMANARARYMEAFTDTEDAARTGDPGDGLERCSARLIEIEAITSSWESKRTDAALRVSALASAAGQLARSVESIDAEATSLERSFSEQLAKEGFADAESLARAARSPDDIARREEAVASYERDLSAVTAALEALRPEISRWTGSDPETIEADIAACDGALAETGRKLEENASRLSTLDALKARWDALETERAARATEGSRLKTLADDLTGNNPAKTSFDAWILGMYLEEITAFANTRLERMSEGRYRIKLNESYRKGNSLSGLDLEILDAHTGKTRPAGTLSGGETFMASISLALGLADSIQSRSGGVQLDAVFIDEGFGSLDESSLERAIGILDEIRGSRMVGLISHVGELRNRIPNRIEIIKTGAGSEIRAETL